MTPPRLVLLLLLCLTPCAAPAQTALWRHFDTSIDDRQLDPRPISELGPVRASAIEAFALEARASDVDCSATSDLRGWEKNLSFTDIHAGVRRITLVQGQCPPSMDVNWLVAWNGTQPVNLAAPARLGCWFHRFQPRVSYGLHDFTMGCHHSAFATDYSWYRFDGNVYRRISFVTAYERDELGRQLMAQDRRQCQHDRRICNLIEYSPHDR